MTDARLPGRWLNSPTLDQLSDRAWRVHTHALMWSAEQGTDGLIPRRTLRLLHPDGASDDDVSELVAVELWAVEGSDLRVVDWAKTQSPAEVVERQRERNRRNQQASRDRARERAVSGDVIADVSDHVGGKDRRGEARTSSQRATATERSASTRGTRLAADFTLDEQLLSYTLEHAPSINATRELEAFRDYWAAQPGAKGVKSDWRATWRMWVRRGHERAVADGWKPSRGAASATSQLDAWLAARGVSRDEYERRKGETGWLESLREVA